MAKHKLKQNYQQIHKTISSFDNFVTKHCYINPPKLSIKNKLREFFCNDLQYLSSNLVTYTYTKNYIKGKVVCGIRYDQESKTRQLKTLLDALSKHENRIDCNDTKVKSKVKQENRYMQINSTKQKLDKTQQFNNKMQRVFTNHNISSESLGKKLLLLGLTLERQSIQTIIFCNKHSFQVSL